MKRMAAICAVLLFILLVAGCGGRREDAQAAAAVRETAVPEQQPVAPVPVPAAGPAKMVEEAQATPEQTSIPQAEETAEGVGAQQETKQALEDILDGMEDVKAAASGLDEAEESGVAIPTP